MNGVDDARKSGLEKSKPKEADRNTLVKIAFDALKVKLNVQKWQEGQLSANSTNRAKTIERIDVLHYEQLNLLYAKLMASILLGECSPSLVQTK